MSIRAFTASLFGVSLLLVSATCLAQESTPESIPAAKQATTEAGIAQLIKDLDGNRFSKRQDASRTLKEIGEPAIAKLTEAVLGPSREASSRAFEILKAHFASEDENLKATAKAALQKLTESDKAAIARDAKEVLDPKPQQPAQRMVPVRGAQIQIQFGGGGAQRVQMRNANGVKDIDIKENNRSIKIHEDPNKGIRVEITENKNGKDVKSKFEAKDAAELKKKHPEAHKIYEKYNRGGQIQLQAPFAPRGFQMPGMRPVLPARARRMIDAKPIAEQLEKISQQVEEAQKLLEQAKSAPEQTESLQKAIDQLKEAQKALKETRDKTG